MSNEPKQAPLSEPSWLKALNLSERALLLKRGGPRAALAQELELARKRMERWRSQAPFADEGAFRRRLQADDLTEGDMLRLLGRSPESLSEWLPSKPSWLEQVEQAFSHPAPRAGGGGESGGREAETPRPRFDGYLRGVAPLLRDGRASLAAGIELLRRAYGHLPFDPEAVQREFLSELSARLLGDAMRTLILELNVARLEGVLEGATPEERFDSFNRRLGDPEHLVPILQEYPVLARQITQRVERWTRSSLEMLQRLCADREELKETFAGGREPGPLAHVVRGAGDTHRGGRSVSILVFEGGLRVVYKPHSLSVDAHFAELLGWINANGDGPPLRAPRVLDRGDYGWAEFIPAEGCSTAGEVERFYRRQGGLLALLYALEATDFHLENLIAAGETPVLVDLESLFHPRLKAGAPGRHGSSPATHAIEHSVMRIGLLPQRIWMVDDHEGVDLSGLGGAPGQLSPFPVMTVENRSTDEMRIEPKRVELRAGLNRPTLNGGEVDLQRFRGPLIEGFASVYKLLFRRREELLAPGGPLSRFACDPVRAVLRATRIYAQLLADSTHPDMLRDALDRARLFDRLWRGAEESGLERATPAEIADLDEGDIPFFSSRPDSRDVWTSRGRRIPEFFEESGLRAAGRRLRGLSEEDMARQVWFITASLSSLAPWHTHGEVARAKFEASRPAPSRRRLIAAAERVAARLEGLAIRDESHVGWIGLTSVDGRGWTLMPLFDDIFNGSLGIALFLAYLGDLTGGERHTALAKLVVENARRRIEPLLAGDAPPEALRGEAAGGYAGVGSTIYAFAHLGSLWDDPALLAAAESLVGLAPRQIEADESLDVVGGSAGCVGNLLALYASTNSPRALAAARQCADRLVERALADGGRIGWRTALTGDKPLTGFSHGAAGMAWALLEVWAHTREEKYREVALGALAYERSVFSAARGNWPDYRANAPRPGGESFMVTWCHGAPGIGLSRLRALQLLGGDEELRAEIGAAVETTLERGFGMSHCLCHGDLGNLDFIARAGRVLGDAGLSARAGRIAGGVLRSIDREGWLCGTPFGTETPGLMMGLAGIGYGLIRLAAPERVPSVLTLDPPRVGPHPAAGARASA